MDNTPIDFLKLKQIAPKAWQDVLEFYQENFPVYASQEMLQLEKLPLEFSLGIFLNYFIENGVVWDVTNTDYALLPETLIDEFEAYEKVISHYS